ncbi:MAG: hypothetical protein Q8P35_02015 [Candidatus Yanofskybacteria bacterium]|nr:hypothetical protein [Candidatus Yanofskybacteria bacterium]
MAQMNLAVQERLAASTASVAIYCHVEDEDNLQLNRLKILLASKRYIVKSFIGMEKLGTALVIHGIPTQYTRKRFTDLLKEHRVLFPQL